MQSILPISFRFRGQIRRLFALYECFTEKPDQALHPTQLARMSGISFTEVARRLDATPELFVKLPARPDGVRRYRLTSTIATRTAEEVEAFLVKSARRETILLYTFGFMLLCIFAIVVALMGPAL